MFEQLLSRLAIASDSAEIDRVLQVLSDLDHTVLVDKAVDFVAETKVLPAVEPVDGIRVDLIFSNSTYERQAIERSKSVDIGERRSNSQPRKISSSIR